MVLSLGHFFCGGVCAVLFLLVSESLFSFWNPPIPLLSAWILGGADLDPCCRDEYVTQD